MPHQEQKPADDRVILGSPLRAWLAIAVLILCGGLVYDVIHATGFDRSTALLAYSMVASTIIVALVIGGSVAVMGDAGQTP
jgi:hypothetical protein